MLNEENLISTLEQSLRQTRNAQTRLLARLREVEAEAETLRTEIDALQNSAEKTEEAIDSLFSTMRTGNKTWKRNPPPRFEDHDDYEMPPEPRRYTRAGNNSPNQQQHQQPPPPQNNYRSSQVTYSNQPPNVPPNTQFIEQKSFRFAERTITQACILLLREANQPLHVNELFNLLVEGGFEFKGNNPTISIAVSLNRNRRFRKVAPGTFDLATRDSSPKFS